MRHEDVIEVLDRPLARELLSTGIPMRLAYTALDGTPRAIPLGFTMRDSNFVVCTATRAAKVKALQANPDVALTIDAHGFPPKVLLARGSCTVEIVDGIPEEYLDMNNDFVGEENREAWEAGVRSLYKQMARIVITPNWAKLLDFETTLPSAVEELLREQSEEN